METKVTTPVRFRSAYDRDYLDAKGSPIKLGTVNNEESMTQQSDKDDADINVIVSRFHKTGQMPQVQRPAMYGDFTDALDFRACQEHLHTANQSFAELPAKIRKRFHNDPAEFIEFMNDPDNAEEMIKLGLATKPKKDEHTPAPNPANGEHNGSPNEGTGGGT